MINRPRRLRNTDSLRSIVRETVLNVEDLVYPVFVKDGHGIKEHISSMPGQYRFSVDTLKDECVEMVKLGLKSILIFGLANHRDDTGSESHNPNGSVQNAIRMIKTNFPELVVMTDVCVCGYTNHGHCGIVHDDYVVND